LPQRPKVYQDLFKNCLDTLQMSNVKDAFVLKAGAIAVIPKIDGVAATQENIASGSYKIVRPLAVIYSNTAVLPPAVRAFFEFVKSAEGQRIAAAAF